MIWTSRPHLTTSSLAIALAAGVLYHAGCGNGGGDQTVVQIAPDAAKKNQDMLDKMHKDAIAKYKKAPGKR